MQEHLDDIEVQIWEYLDGSCSEADTQRIAQLISSNELWKQRYAELLAFQGELAGMETDHPSMRFAANVMDSIASTQVLSTTARYLNNWVVKGIAAFFLVLVGSMIVLSLVAINSSPENGSNTVGLERYMTTDALKIVMFVNILLGLMLVDKLLNKRRQKTLV